MLKQTTQRMAEQQEREIRIEGATLAAQLDRALLSKRKRETVIRKDEKERGRVWEFVLHSHDD